MSRGFKVDQFGSPQALDALYNRCAAVEKTVAALGLCGITEAEDPALIFGGGAATMWRVDTYIPGDGPSDVDVVVNRPMFNRLRSTGEMSVCSFFEDGNQGMIAPSESRPLHVDVLTTTDPSTLTRFIGDEPYTGKPNRDMTLINGVLVLSPLVVVREKVRYKTNRVRDVAGVVKANVVAYHQNNPVRETSEWRDAVARAVDRVLDRRISKDVPRWREVTGRGPKYPSWLRQLVRADFEHPAFEDIPHM